MHAAFDGSKQLTSWRPCKVRTFAALHRSTHRANKGKSLLGWKGRDYRGLVMQSKVFIGPLKEASA